MGGVDVMYGARGGGGDQEKAGGGALEMIGLLTDSWVSDRSVFLRYVMSPQHSTSRSLPIRKHGRQILKKDSSLRQKASMSKAIHVDTL